MFILNVTSIWSGHGGLIHMASRNCLSIRSAPNYFSSTAKVKSTGPCATPPKWELIGFSFLSRTSLKCSVILSRNSRSVSPTYTVQSHLEQIIAYTTLRARHVASLTGVYEMLPEVSLIWSLTICWHFSHPSWHVWRFISLTMDKGVAYVPVSSEGYNGRLFINFYHFFWAV